MIDLIATALVLCVGLVLLALTLRFASPREVRLLSLSFAAHILSAFAQILLTVYFFGGGDMLAYHRFGMMYVEYLRQDFAFYAPELVRYVLRMPAVEHEFFMQGSATGAMMGLSTWLMLLVGGSLYASGALIAVLAFLSKFMMYKGFCVSLPSRFHTRALVAAMLMPSTVFWSSGLLKEPIALLGFGPAFWGVAQLIHGQRRLSGAMAVALGVVPVGLIKPYILFPFALCSAAWFYWNRSLSVKGHVGLLKKPLYVVVAVVGAVAGLQLLGTLFPEFGVENLADEAAGLQEIGMRVRGGSHYTIIAAPSRSLAGQLLIAPLGLLFALFRPMLFDVRNAVLLLNTLEMTAIMWLWWRAWRQRGGGSSVQLILSSPLLVFCVLFCVLFGAAVGISSTNIGTLSRYRVPMMPFYLLTLLVLTAPMVAERHRSQR